MKKVAKLQAENCSDCQKKFTSRAEINCFNVENIRSKINKRTKKHQWVMFFLCESCFKREHIINILHYSEKIR